MSGFADQIIAGCARWKQFGFGSQALRFIGKSFFKRLGLVEKATIHDTTSLAFTVPTPQGFEDVPILICRLPPSVH
jgi:hypothetical protein